MSSGGFNPSPRRFGGTSENIYSVLLDSLIDGMGTALSDDIDSFAYAESFAEARALAALFSSIKRFSYLWDPERMPSEMIPRWEAIFGLSSSVLTSEVDRRAALKLSFSFIQGNTVPIIHDLVVSLLPNIFVAINHGSSATAHARVPGGGTAGSIPAFDDGPWTSTIAELDIQVIQPPTVTDLDFAQERAGLSPALAKALPAWADWHTRVDGPSGMGFFLDEQNLDREVFRV